MKRKRLRSPFGVCVVLLHLAGSLVGGRILEGQQKIAAGRNATDDARAADQILTRRITIALTQVSRAEAIDSISRVANVFVQYRGRVFDSDSKKINVHAVALPLGVVLEQVLDGTGLLVKVGDLGRLTLVPARAVDAAHAAGAQDSTTGVGDVRGHVVDSATGRGLSGVTIKVVGTKISTTSQDSGHFTLNGVPAGNHTLVARLFGYRPLEHLVTVTTGEQTTVKLAMVSVPTVLSGVVTTATGVQRKIEVGNDITTLNVDSIQQTAPITSVTDLLETRVPGLTVLHSDGVPGDPSRLRLRGAGSIQLNNDPIVVVDGIRVYASQSDTRNDNLAPGNAGGGLAYATHGGGGGSYGYATPSPIDQIDPSSIATIEVLKGPSATAIYGSDAANGVIVITTKHGRAGPTHWTVNVGTGVNWLPGDWPNNFFRFGEDSLVTNATFNSGKFPGLCQWNDVGCHTDSVVAFQALNDPRSTVFAHGSDQTGSLTVSGGVPTLLYSFTGSADGDIGNVKMPEIEQRLYTASYGPIPRSLVRPDNYQRWGITGSLTAQPTSTAQVTLQSSVFNSTQQQSSLNTAINQLSGIYFNTAMIAGCNFSGCTSLPLETTPLISNEVERVTAGKWTSRNALTMSWTPRPWLPLNATAGIETEQRNDQTYVPYGVSPLGARNLGCNTTGGALCGTEDDTAGSYGLGRGTSRVQTLSVGTAIPLRYLTVSVGGNLYSQSTADFRVFTNQLAPGVTVPTQFLTCNYYTGTTTIPCINSPTTQSTTNQSTYGWYVEPRLNIASKFFVAPGFRLDGGSGASTSAGSIGGLSAFPKIDLSYVAVDRQSGPPLFGVLTLLRPRIAFGYAGTQPEPAMKLRLFNGRSGSNEFAISGLDTIQVNGCGLGITVCLATLGNTQLRPERTAELEGGFDMNLWDNRLQVTYSRSTKTRKDAILSIPVAPSVSGFNGQAFVIEKNIGEIRNTGTEMTINAMVLQREAVSWNVTANLTNNNSLVVRLNPGQAPICFGTGTPCQGSRVVAGYPLFGEWVQPIVSFVDVNHNRIIDPSELRFGDSAVYVGQPTPKYQFNLSTNITLLNGRLSVNATVAYQNGLTQDNQGACSSGAFALLPNTPNTSLATQAAVVSSSCGVGSGGYLYSQNVTSNYGLYQTVNTLRFNDLSINYNVPRTVSNWFRVPRMSVALQGSNLGLHTNYRGLDPDVNAFSTVSAGDETADLGQIPEPRTWWLKLSLGN